MISIRAYDPGNDRDIDAITAIYAHHVSFGRASFETQPPSRQDMFSRFAALAEDGYPALVAEQDGRLVGLAHVLFHRSTWSPTVYCYLEDLFVDIDTRRQGLGRALIEMVYREADKRGATRTYWATREDNKTARRIYARLAKLSPFVQYRR